MRYPFIQIHQDTRAKVRDLATLLKADRQKCAGQLEDLIPWALDRSPDTRAPDGVIAGDDAALLIEGAVEWAGEPGAWVAAALRAGLLVKRKRGLALAPELVEGPRKSYAERVAARKRKDAYRDRPGPAGTLAEREPSPSGTRTVAEVRRTEAEAEAEAEASSSETLSRASGAPPSDQLPLDGVPAGAGRESGGDSPGDSVEVLRKSWNQMAARYGLPTWKQTSAARRKAVTTAIRARKLRGCQDLVAAVDASPFLRGEKTDFRATPDWLFQATNAAKVAEGNYADRGPAGSAQAQAPPRREPKDEADRLWFQMLDQLRKAERHEIARQLEAGGLLTRVDGGALVVAQGDGLYMSWVQKEYGQLLHEAAVAQGITLVLEDSYEAVSG